MRRAFGLGFSALLATAATIGSPAAAAAAAARVPAWSEAVAPAMQAVLDYVRGQRTTGRDFDETLWEKLGAALP